jgi:hypothetical protein
VRALLAVVLLAASPGPKGLEGVPIPQVPVLQQAQAVHLNQTIDGVKCQSTEKVVFHIHAHLVIYVNGKQRQVPYGIGIGPPLKGQNAPAGPFVTEGSCFMWMHTHTADGIIHMEAPKQITFNLGQFFDVWGAKLSKTQVGPAKGTVSVLLNGKAYTGDPRAIVLKKHAQIQLMVGKQMPRQTISFGTL